MTAVRDLQFDTLQLEQNGRVLTVRMSCPPLNFGTIAFVRELDRLTSSLDHDPTVGASCLPAASRAAGSRIWTPASSAA
jgi:enoyl-CoA hydratase/carnithine racemase